jgi:transcriptional regulator with XRE-family HTH domain
LTRSNPTVARIRLAALFREVRERSGRSLDDLSRFLNISAPQASRLDSGARGFRPQDVSRLAEWYGFGEADTAGLVALAEESRRREWWQQVDLPDAYRTYIGMEQMARTISEYNAHVIPGLLQTDDYARVAAVAGAVEIDPNVTTDQVDQAVEVRLHRQAILDGDTPPKLDVVIDEAVLARGPRDVAIRRRQLEHLRAATDRPNITVQVIGFEYGLHTSARGNFILLGMGGELPDLFYSEGVQGAYHTIDGETLDLNRRIWSELRAKALDKFASKDRIQWYLDHRT